jgi:hypothetical protein
MLPDLLSFPYVLSSPSDQDDLSTHNFAAGASSMEGTINKTK